MRILNQHANPCMKHRLGSPHHSHCGGNLIPPASRNYQVLGTDHGASCWGNFAWTTSSMLSWPCWDARHKENRGHKGVTATHLPFQWDLVLISMMKENQINTSTCFHMIHMSQMLSWAHLHSASAPGYTLYGYFCISRMWTCHSHFHTRALGPNQSESPPWTLFSFCFSPPACCSLPSDLPTISVPPLEQWSPTTVEIWNPYSWGHSNWTGPTWPCSCSLFRQLGIPYSKNSPWHQPTEQGPWGIPPPYCSKSPKISDKQPHAFPSSHL